ncbi:NAD(P)/FAD-dependent oxidoreductase [Aureibaculum sp. 2210JD6-5]|uniref:NAD(P)/FAD-dependent oxidoreductase n=1 Tax=Aureibaculum sp. 2210JD6-5 TaxID=3103957 RepID=UPI002AACBFF2|nr:NAD(P)/FAD-dependent oxidoreductase [Aureibaculum sp. 2210JD6-5]MDY7395327.1 NAD(P)/FAD-dependent oxidoreductase [Aureibaculum sp. 2210JD6-5]
MPDLKTVFIPKSKHPRIVIIGAGFAGIHLAKALKNKPFQIVMIDKNNFHQFQPLLYQVATSGLEPDSIVFPIRKIFRGYKNFVFRMTDVLNINSNNKSIETDIGTIDYDYLVLATGSTNNFYGLKDVETHSIGLKTIQESLDIRSNILQNIEKANQSDNEETRKINTNIVIIGAGPAGVEMAGAFAEFKKFIYPKDYPELRNFPLQIHVVEAGKEVLSAMSNKSSADSLKDLQKMKVNVHLDTAIKSYDGKTVVLSSGETILSSSLIWTAGVKGQFPNGLNSKNIAQGNRIAVDEFNRLKGYKSIFAIGDVAFMQTENYPKGHPMVAPTAIQQGQHLAKNLLLDETDWKPFKYFDKGSLATIGKRKAVADFGKLHFRGRIAWLIWSTVHLISISGFKNKLRVGLNWINNYFSYDKGNRLIIRKYNPK